MPLIANDYSRIRNSRISIYSRISITPPRISVTSNMPRIDQINELLRSELANLINQEIKLDNGLITVCYVDCSPDLKNAKINISVLPDNLSGTALQKLRKHSGLFRKTLNKKLNLKYIPKFNWVIDATEKNAAEIEEILKQIKNP